MEKEPVLSGVPVGLFATNCWILACPDTRQAAIVDPGGAPALILATIQSLGVTPQVIINTHGHLDHTAANADMAAAFGIPLGIHRDDLFLLRGKDLLGLTAILQASPSPEPGFFLEENEPLAVGNLSIRFLHTPGHSPGSCCLWVANRLISGDSLFAGGIGRTDLPGGNHAQLMDSLARKILVLPPDTRVYPGHGPETTIIEELEDNPFLPDPVFSDRSQA